MSGILAARGIAVTATHRLDVSADPAAVIVIDHRELRRLSSSAPASGRILALVPHPDEASIRAAFAAGAADVLAGPVRVAELVSRVAVLSARAAACSPIRIGQLVIDAAAQRVTVAGTPVALTRGEYLLLRRLASAPGQVFTKQELLRELWGQPIGAPTRRLDTQIARLRHRLGQHRTLVVTVWGVGYRLGG